MHTYRHIVYHFAYSVLNDIFHRIHISIGTSQIASRSVSVHLYIHISGRSAAIVELFTFITVEPIYVGLHFLKDLIKFRSNNPWPDTFFWAKVVSRSPEAR